MIDVQFDLNKADLNYISKMPKLFSVGILKGLRKVAFEAEGLVKKGFGTGSGPPNRPPGPLKIRSGHLRRSIRSGVIKSSMSAWVGTDVFYGKVHEESVKFPRPFLYPPVKNNIDDLNEILRNSILKEYN